MKKSYKDKLKSTQLEILDYIVEICEKNNLEYFLMGGTLLGAVRHGGFIPWDDDIDICMPRKDYEIFKKLHKDNLGKFILDDFSTNPHYWLPFIKIRNSKTIYQENVLMNYKGNSGIWVDIFPLDNGDNQNSLLQRTQFRFTGILRSTISMKEGVVLSKDKFIKRFLSICFLILPKKTIISIQKKLMTINNNHNSKYVMSLGSQYGYHKQTHLREKWYPVKKIKFENKEYNIPNDYNYVLTNIYGANYMELPPVEKRITHNPVKVVFEDGEEVLFDEKI